LRALLSKGVNYLETVDYFARVQILGVKFCASACGGSVHAYSFGAVSELAQGAVPLAVDENA
jgi:hypothetical protein